MASELLTHIEANSEFVFLDRNDAEDAELARTIAQMVMNWARLDYALYAALRARDIAKADQWMRMLTNSHLLGHKIEATKKELADISGENEYVRNALDEAIAVLNSVRGNRNLLAHGLWRRVDSDSFDIFPLQIGDDGNLASPIRKTRSEIRDVFRQMQTAIEKLVMLRAKIRQHVAPSNQASASSRQLS